MQKYVQLALAGYREIPTYFNIIILALCLSSTLFWVNHTGNPAQIRNPMEEKDRHRGSPTSEATMIGSYLKIQHLNTYEKCQNKIVTL